MPLIPCQAPVLPISIPVPEHRIGIASFSPNISPGEGAINELVLEISPYDFLLNAARLHKSQLCATVIRRMAQSAKLGIDRSIPMGILYISRDGNYGERNKSINSS